MKTSSQWQIEKDFLCKEFIFDNFSQAIQCINQIASLAEEKNHHPDIQLYSYKKIKILLRTHAENQITKKDYCLAKEIDNLLQAQ